MRAPKTTMAHARRLRRVMTLPEVVLWQRLRREGIGYRFRRQHPVGPYVLDFYCSDAQLAIEVDGASHDIADQAAHDERRTAWLAERGIAVLRLPAADVLRGEEAEHVLETIVAVCAERIASGPLHRPSDGPPPPLRV